MTSQLCMVGTKNIHSLEKPPEILLRLWLTQVTTAVFLASLQKSNWDVYCCQNILTQINLIKCHVHFSFLGLNVTKCLLESKMTQFSLRYLWLIDLSTHNRLGENSSFTFDDSYTFRYLFEHFCSSWMHHISTCCWHYSFLPGSFIPHNLISTTDAAFSFPFHTCKMADAPCSQYLVLQVQLVLTKNAKGWHG